MAIPLTDRVPYIKWPDGTKNEIIFTAKNVNMYENGPTVQQKIEALEETITTLTSMMSDLQQENVRLRTALETQVNNLRDVVEDSALTKDKIVEALGYEPAAISSQTAFEGARAATSYSVGKDGVAGLVPQPLSSDYDSFLCGNGTWKQIDMSQFLTRVEAEVMFLPINGKADSAWQADVATVAYNVPTTAKGNIWIKDNNG